MLVSSDTVNVVSLSSDNCRQNELVKGFTDLPNAFPVGSKARYTPPIQLLSPVASYDVLSEFVLGFRESRGTKASLSNRLLDIIVAS